MLIKLLNFNEMIYMYSTNSFENNLKTIISRYNGSIT